MSGEYATGLVASTTHAYLRADREAEGPKPTAAGTLGRASSVLNCWRQIALDMARVVECEEIGFETLLAFKLGNAMHEEIQAALGSLFPDFEAEVPVDLRPFGFDVSGSADGVLRVGDGLTVVEIKTEKAFPFGLAAESGAPKLAYIVQAGVYAYGLGADAIHIATVCKETDYRKKLSPGQMAEWTFGLDDMIVEAGDSVRSVVEIELTRLQRIVELVRDGVIPDRIIPGEGLIEKPPPYQGRGQPWQCRFCRHNATCRMMPSGSVAVEDAPVDVQVSWNTLQPESV